jgi:hypothetical protein
MKTIKTTLLVALTALALGCGYTSKPTPGAMPAISQLNPDSVKAGGAPFILTINGSNFASQAVVNWNSTPQNTTTYVSGGQLTVGIPASLITNPGTVQISVTNPGTSGTGMYGTGGTLAETSASVGFTIH